MSDKTIQALNHLDFLIRRALPTGMEQGTKLTIEFFCGFELFNTRPYHNYETWSDGYRVTGQGVTVEAEDLDDAVRLWIEQYEARKEAPHA